MPYRLTTKTQLTDEQGKTLEPVVEIPSSEVLSLFEFKDIGGNKRARVRRVKPPGSPEGWVAASQLIPLYGQTARKHGLVLEGNQETRDKCRQLVKRLDACFNVGGVTGPTAFMMGVLLCETLDGEKVFYAAHAGNWAVSVFEREASALGCTTAGSVQNGSEHFRDLSGNVFKARPKTGARQNRPAGLHPADPSQGGDWDIDRLGNDPGTCAAQKMLQLAIKHTATPRHMWEQWYDSQHTALTDGLPIESCTTCSVNIPRMLDRGAKK